MRFLPSYETCQWLGPLLGLISNLIGWGAAFYVIRHFILKYW